VRALAVLRASGRPVPTLVVLGGPSGRPTAVRELAALAAASGVSEHLTIRPPVPRPALVDWYRAADVVAMPSRSESFGLVAAEAQASGTPVLAARVGGLRSVVAEGVSGRLVAGHDPETWADAIAEILADDAARAILGRGARDHAQQFGWDVAAEAVLHVYDAAREHRAAR